MKINLTDNNIGKFKENIFKREDVASLFPFGNKSIAQLCKENEHLLIFPYDIETSDDRIGESSVFNIENTEDPDYVRLITNNVLGFIGIDSLKIKIKSRFDEGRDDYLLHYMLQKILSFNLFELKHNNAEESIFDFIMFMFPYLLKSALKQGLYREYQKQECNDANMKGTININKCIRQNLPFNGRISYTVRNYSCDNSITQLIRHTIEFMRSKKYGQSVLNIDNETKENVQSIIEHTPTYNKQERNSIIQKNLRPKVHPYYTAYKPLQNLCIQILRMEEIKYGEKENEINGILFDGAWLWEEYINTLLKPYGFKHPENKSGKGGFHLFESIDASGKIHQSGRRYPDFYKENFVLDAKYKRYGNYTKVSQVNRDDIHQLITYIARLKADKGAFVVPLQNKQETIPSAHLKNSTASLFIYGIQIDKVATSYEDFRKNMEILESEFLKSFTL